MLKAEKPRMQSLPRERRGGKVGFRLGLGLGTRRSSCLPVHRIADQWMAQMRQMHADLMRAPCLQPAFDQAGEGAGFAAVTFQHPIPRARGLPLIAHDGHALAVERVTPDVTFNDAFARAWCAPRRGMVGAI